MGTETVNKRLIISLLIFFVITISLVKDAEFTSTVVSTANFVKLDNVDPQATANANTESIIHKRNSVLIMASYRGGSTLAGEIFNRNEDVLYYFGNVVLNN